MTAPDSFAYLLQADSFAKDKASAIRRLAESKRDWIVVDPDFSKGIPWTKSDLEAIRRAKPGRKVIAYLSIGEAEDYRSYWKDDWVSNGIPTHSAPPWLVAENPEWAGNYRVKYWDADWQAIMLRAVDVAMTSGFDGVYLDIVNGFEFFEKKGREFIDDRLNPETGRSYRLDMIAWVKAIAGRARKGQAAAVVIPQNGSQLLAYPDYLAAIDAIGIEDLFTDGDRLNPKSEADDILGFLKKMKAKNKPVLLIEYPTTEERKEFVEKAAQKQGFAWLLTDRNLTTLGISGK